MESSTEYLIPDSVSPSVKLVEDDTGTCSKTSEGPTVPKSQEESVKQNPRYERTETVQGHAPISTDLRSGPFPHPNSSPGEVVPPSNNFPTDRNHMSYAPPPPPPRYGGYYNNYNYTNNEEEEEDGPWPFLKGVSLVALGGLVGLTAAATVRWLNGGDFQWLPPPSIPEKENSHQQKSLVLGDDHVDVGRDQMEDFVDTAEEEYATDDDDDNNNDHHHNNNNHPNGTMLGWVPETQERVLEQLQSISESIKTHVSIQEKILLKMSTQGSSITNHSMELLRKSSGVSTSEDVSKVPEALMICTQLLDVRGELLKLQDRKHDANLEESTVHAWEGQLSTVLSRLDSCLETIQSSYTSQATKAQSLNVSIPVTSASASASGSIQQTQAQTPGRPFKEKLTDQDNDMSPPRCLTLRQVVRIMVQENDATTLRVGSQLLYLYIINLIGAPTNPRYRKIFTTNESFQKVESMAGGKDLLLAVGFEESKGCLEWLASNDASPEGEQLALKKLEEAVAALGILKSTAPSIDLTERVLEVLPPDSDEHVVAPESLIPPSTPDTSFLVSPPQPRKMPFVHLANEARTQEDIDG